MGTRRVKPTAVYLIQSESDSGLYKVGLSDLVPRRNAQIHDTYNLGGVVQCEAWFPTRIGALEAERKWHYHLFPFRDCPNGGREWFRLPDHITGYFYQWAGQSRSAMPLKASIRSGRMTPYQKQQLTHQLLKSIPDGRAKIPEAISLGRSAST